MNNLEFDHADIFVNLQAIQTQFHHLLRTVPSDGLVIYPKQEQALQQVVDMGCWASLQTLGGDWHYLPVVADGSEFLVSFAGQEVGKVSWSLTGQHNMNNAIAAMAAARHVGVEPHISCQALSEFQGVKRRMELLATVNGISVYDDFAHHPTAIATTLSGLRAKAGKAKITAIIEPRSNTMKMGVHQKTLKQSSEQADTVYWMESEKMTWSVIDGVSHSGATTQHIICHKTADIIQQVVAGASPGEQIVIMSNGGFNGIHSALIQALRERYEH
jgi:UDP-N-acetylmuramate: L-alanyl-gamma-D-glutamyl-meso-diaminopimelate ligase